MLYFYVTPKKYVMSSKKTFTLFFLALLCAGLPAQKLKSGFDKAEYTEMLKIAQKQHIDVDQWDKNTSIPDPELYKLVYRSPVMGLSNIWDLWLGKDSVAVISVRGTISDPASWLANFYAAMVPARGELQLEKSFAFKYNLCDDPKAAVHVGWLISTAYLSKDMMPKIDSCYRHLGIKNYILTGYSQGGAISFLLTSYLESMKRDQRLPADIRFKTYCGAAPKPGNLYFAYHYENLTRNGWAYNVVNSADWVPETPFSLQTLDDFNTVNIFRGARQVIRQRKFLERVALNHVYRRLSKPGKRALKNYQKYLGHMVYKAVKKQLPDFKAPVYFNSNNYVRTGETVVLYADDDYYKLFPPDQARVWQHHMILPYLYLTGKLK